MPQLDVGRRAARCVVVYHGPRRAGKTETLQALRRAISPERRGDVLSRPSGVHPALFVEHLRLRPCRIGDLTLELDLVALPDHEALPLLGDLLRVTDGVVFVGDSQASRVAEDRAALRALELALRAGGVELAGLPVALQWNKRDLPGALPLTELARAVGARGRPGFASTATRGEGVLPPLREVARSIVRGLTSRRRDPGSGAVPAFGPRGRARGHARGAA